MNDELKALERRMDEIETRVNTLQNPTEIGPHEITALKKALGL